MKTITTIIITCPSTLEINNSMYYQLQKSLLNFAQNFRKLKGIYKKIKKLRPKQKTQEIREV